MKKIMSMILSVAMLISMSACGKKQETAKGSVANKVTQKTEKTQQFKEEHKSDEKEVWRQFLTDYEAWVDSYNDALAAMESNPTEPEIMNIYVDMLTEIEGWEEEADKLEAELEKTQPEELPEYESQIERINKKIKKSEE